MHMISFSASEVLPIAHPEERASLSLFLKFLRLEIMYFSWPKMKALE